VPVQDEFARAARRERSQQQNGSPSPSGDGSRPQKDYLYHERSKKELADFSKVRWGCLSTAVGFLGDCCFCATKGTQPQAP
jgi:hypothetical protein